MRLIDADKLRESVLKWLPPDPCGQEEKEYPFETDICVSMLQEIEEAPTVEPEQRWIPCSERLPEEDVEVLITYRYKEGEGDTSYADIDITTYGQMYFGGNKVGNHKHWRQPFEYFESNYEVVAWMPLPEPYKGDTNEQNNENCL